MELKAVTGKAVGLAETLLRKNGIAGPVLDVLQFQDTVLEKVYAVYRIETPGGRWVMKPGRREWEVYRTYFAGRQMPVPRLLPCTVEDGADCWFLMEYLEGPDLCWAAPETMEQAAEALVSLETAFWQIPAEKEHIQRLCGFFRRVGQRFSQYPKLQRELETLALRMENSPRTLIHDDLLPINVLCTQTGIRFVDWDYAASAPYMMDVCRLFAHTELYMTQEAAQAGLRRYQERLLQCVADLTPQQLQEDLRLGLIGELATCLPREPEDQWNQQDKQTRLRLLALCK